MSEPGGRGSFRPIRWWMAAAGLLVSLAIMAGAYYWLSTAAVGGGEAARLQVEVIRTALSVGAGMGGGAALMLAWRRQWLQEHDQQHREASTAADQRLRERVAEQDRFNATESRITELYVQAVEQLGSDRAPVRLAGLFALDRLGRDNSWQRQTIVHVICSYLRIPAARPSGRRPDQEELAERQVRRTAMQILRTHLRPHASLRLTPEPNRQFWKDIKIDLSGAQLDDFDLTHCQVASADFSGATFHGDTWFSHTRFDTEADFRGASFIGDVWFERCTGEASLSHAGFHRTAHFPFARFSGFTLHGAVFHGPAVFHNASFTGATSFLDVEFGRRADFSGARFDSGVDFEDARFEGPARFQHTRFGGTTGFVHCRFDESTTFDRAGFAGPLELVETSFKHGVRYDDAVFHDEVSIKDCRVADQPPQFRLPDGWRLGAGAARSGGALLEIIEPDEATSIPAQYGEPDPVSDPADRDGP